MTINNESDNEYSKSKYNSSLEMLLRYASYFKYGKDANGSRYPGYGSILESYEHSLGRFPRNSTSINIFEASIAQTAIKNITRFRAEWIRKNNKTFTAFLQNRLSYYENAANKLRDIKNNNIQLLLDITNNSEPAFLRTCPDKTIEDMSLVELADNGKSANDLFLNAAKTFTAINNFQIYLANNHKEGIKHENTCEELSNISIDQDYITLADMCYYLTFAQAIGSICRRLKKQLGESKKFNRFNKNSFQNKEQAYYKEWAKEVHSFNSPTMPSIDWSLIDEDKMTSEQDEAYVRRNTKSPLTSPINPNDLKELYKIACIYNDKKRALKLVESRFYMARTKEDSSVLKDAYSVGTKLKKIFKQQSSISVNYLEYFTDLRGNIVENVVWYGTENRLGKNISFSRIYKEMMLSHSIEYLETQLPNYKSYMPSLNKTFLPRKDGKTEFVYF